MRASPGFDPVAAILVAMGTGLLFAAATWAWSRSLATTGVGCVAFLPFLATGVVPSWRAWAGQSPVSGVLAVGALVLAVLSLSSFPALSSVAGAWACVPLVARWNRPGPGEEK